MSLQYLLHFWKKKKSQCVRSKEYRAMWDKSYAVFAQSRESCSIFMSETPVSMAPFFTLFSQQSIKILVQFVPVK
jgi:hypothetical protein